ncbi:unnamed protein product [Sympodiomycopsis kandeliae]
MASSMSTAAAIPAASVSLHPLASRDGQHSSTIVSVQVPRHPVDHDGLPGLDDIQASLDIPMTGGDPFQHGPRQPLQSTPPRSYQSSSNGLPHHHDGSAAYSASGSVMDSDIYHGEYTPPRDDRVWGIHHDDIHKYPIIDDQPAMCTYIEEDDFPTMFPVEDAPPIRAMTAAQLAELQAQYSALDVPHSVVFPFLHGVDGTNPAQNHFFKAPPTGQPAPNYRGLTIVRAEMPTPEQQSRMMAHRTRSSSLGSKLSMSCASSGSDLANSTNSRLSHGRADSLAASSVSSHGAASSISQNTASSCDSGPSSDGGDHHSIFNNSKNHLSSTDHHHNPLLHSAAGSSVSFGSSMAPSEASANSLFSYSHADARLDSHTSFSTSAADEDEDMKLGNGKGDDQQQQDRLSPTGSFDPQPDACVLTSTVYPYELVLPPAMMDRTSGVCYYAHARPETVTNSQDAVMFQSARFNTPEQGAGVNLRNFKIQAIKYATISDIVLYCPSGYHEGMLTFARWFRDAHEGSFDERCEKRLGGLRYNVFIVTEPFEAFENNHPHLVAVDGAGVSRNRVDFIDREREEMQRLTAAAPIDDNVWLGCTGDIPSLMESSNTQEDSPLQWSQENNPNGFAVCIELHEQGEVPDIKKLSQANEYLDTICARCASPDQGARDYLSGANDEGWWPRDGLSRPSSPQSAFGPRAQNVNSPGLLRSVASHSKLDLPSTNGNAPSLAAFTRPEGSAYQLECHSFAITQRDSPKEGGKGGDALEDNEQGKIDGILRMCHWIQSQAQPSKAAIQSSHPSSGQGILTGAFKGVQYARQNASGSYGRATSRNPYLAASTPPTPRRIGRRVLLHCGDGYTETSILALAYLMYAKGLSLPDAYLDLQNRASRSFFVYKRDLPFLRELEKHIVALRRDGASDTANEHTSRARGKHSFPWLGVEDNHGKRRNHSSAAPRRNSASSASHEASEHNSWMRGLVGWVGSGSKRATPVHSSSESLPCPPSRTVTPTPASMASRPSATAAPTDATNAPDSALTTGASHAWFNDQRFEGAFPSRILPFLYLGNLNHALNPGMLHALGITHVVSVGESALYPPAVSGAAVADCNGGPTALPSPPDAESGSPLWHEERAGRISVLDLKNVCDDGIDPLRSNMRLAVEYIETARRNGGKVLVHCRVGVSRSTTIVLAYVMAHLDLTLVESYLLVRSRRLSILIQPHLLFFWELRGWETYVASQKLKRCLAQEARRTSLADAHFELAGLSLKGEGARGDLMERISSVGSSCGFGSGNDENAGGLSDDLDVDIGAGAGQPYGINVENVSGSPFGSGSPGGVPAEALRLHWGFLCREITFLNERYF